MSDIKKLIDSCIKSEMFFFKFISANDVGQTGAHQAGFYMPSGIWPMFFNEPGEKDENKDKYITIHWPDSNETESRFIWYGKGTRSEYRLTRGLNFLEDDNVGDIFILSKLDDDNYDGFIISSDDDIEEFLNNFNLSPDDAYKLQKHHKLFEVDKRLEDYFTEWIGTLDIDFPESFVVSNKARDIWIKYYGKDNYKTPDEAILNWIDTEYELFKCLETDRYASILKNPFNSVEDLVVFANSILNRRKARAGKSLENHLSILFDRWAIPYSSEKKTEGNKKPDFIFPGIDEYHDPGYATDKLRFLGAKTTCKDRWRQILNEADRISVKHLCTLQQGISGNQLKEMTKAKVTLVVPKKYHKCFPEQYVSGIKSLESFLRELKGLYPDALRRNQELL